MDTESFISIHSKFGGYLSSAEFESAKPISLKEPRYKVTICLDDPLLLHEKGDSFVVLPDESKVSLDNVKVYCDRKVTAEITQEEFEKLKPYTYIKEK